MKVLYYTWNENSREDILELLPHMGIEVVECGIPIQDYEKDRNFEEQLEKIVRKEECQWIFSFDFFPVIAGAAERMRIKYISWIYDCPHLPLFSPRAKSEYNYIFVFDRMQYERWKTNGIPHLYHLPLAVNTGRLNRQLSLWEEKPDYSYEVSFVGSLYEHNSYDKICYLPEAVRGYLDGVMAAQQKIYGYDIVPELLTAPIMEEIKKYVSFQLNPQYQVEPAEIFAGFIHAKITSEERKGLLREIAQKCRLTVFTGSKLPVSERVEKREGVSYLDEMPRIFRDSKINLNITLRSITSGIPLRALDIMGAGGFLLSNYQQELAEQFEDGRELVLFESEEDMLEKALYYLEREDERWEIAYRGWEKVQKRFSYEKKLKEIFSLVAGQEEGQHG